MIFDTYNLNNAINGAIIMLSYVSII